MNEIESQLKRAYLKQRQAMPLDGKIMMTLSRIHDWYEYWNGQVYISFSGGKDSTVLLDLVRGMYPEVPAVFVDTGLEYPEIREFVKTIDNVVWVRPKKPFTQVIREYGYPVVSKEQSQYIQEARDTHSEKLRDIRFNGNKYGRGKVSDCWKHLIFAPFKISHKCCHYLKKEPVKRYEKESGLKPMVAVMAEESQNRMTAYLINGCNSFDAKRPMSRPMGFWTEQDILQYLKEKEIPYSSIYGNIAETENGLTTTGETRTGCMFCMFGLHQCEGQNKFQRMKTSHPKQYDYCVNQLGLGQVLDYLKVDYK